MKLEDAIKLARDCRSEDGGTYYVTHENGRYSVASGTELQESGSPVLEEVVWDTTRDENGLALYCGANAYLNSGGNKGLPAGTFLSMHECLDSCEHFKYCQVKQIADIFAMSEDEREKLWNSTLDQYRQNAQSVHTANG